MDKRILVVERNSDCPNRIVDRSDGNTKYVCGLADDNKECPFGNIPDWCLLPKMPEKIMLDRNNVYEMAAYAPYAQGYNACLDEILEQKKITKEEKVAKVLELFHNTPDGCIKDSDTVLKVIMDNVSFEETGLSEEILNAWINSSDKESVESLFYSLTDIKFDDYIDLCLRKTTRKSGSAKD